MEKHYHDAFSGAPPLTSNGTLHVLSRVLFLVLCGLWGVTAAQAQDDSYRWVEQNGVYTLTGTAQKGEIATIKVGSFYAPDDHGDATVYFHASGIDTQKDKISLFYPINQDGTGSDTQHGGRIQEGWNNVYLTAQHVEGTTANVQISHIILPTNTTHPIEAMSNIYDINGDGKMEFLGTDFRFHSYQYPGLMPMEQHSIPENGKHARLCNLNNDAFPDIRYLEGGIIALSEQDASWQIPDNVSEAPYPCDYNNDGRIDLMHDNRKIYRQAADGSFSPIEIIPISSEEDTLVYNRWESQPSSSGIGLGNLGGDVGVAIGGSPSAHVATFSSNREFYSMDFNKDGHADLIDESTGTLLLNRGNNRFLLAPQNGRLYPRDLNGDFIMDYICYDEETQTVESMVFQKDGSIKRQTLMSNLAMDKRIHFYDFNADGYVDVLLPFSHSSATGEYCYLVMAINDGKGNFTINEDNTFHRQLFFIGCADVDNDGCYDILALEKNADRKVWNGWECDLYWLKGSKDMLFKEMPGALIPTQIVQYESPEELKGDAEVYAGDFDNDGFCDILVHSMYFERTTDKLPTASNSFLYSFKQEATAANQSPEKPDMPTLVSDAASGMLQINWQPGKDDLTPTADLTYALRIGTAPGKGDIFYACADEQGHRLNLMPGNMEYNLDKTLNVSGWRKGDYYIAVQTIDAMGKGSAWSDAAVYRHEVAHAPFYIADKDITTADTAIMGYDGPADPSLRYNWDLDGGTIISSEASGSILKVVFDQPGQKHITLSVTDAEGNTSTPRTEDLHVSAVRFDKRTLSMNNGYIQQIADIDLDGQPELLAEDGVYQPTKEQDFEKAPGIYNTNLNITLNFAWDYNRDGLVDFIGGMNREDREFKDNLMLNQGNRRFSVTHTVGDAFVPKIGFYVTSYYWEYPIYDFNNDGLPDYYWRNSSGYTDQNDTIYENTGDWRTFVAHPIDNIGFFPSDNWSAHEFDEDFVYTDINGDNLMDMAGWSKQWDENSRLSSHKLVLFINQGNFKFQRIATDIIFDYRETQTIPTFADLNNDGVKDIIIDEEYSDNNRFYHIYLSRNGQVEYENPIVVEGPVGVAKDLIFYDLDNNGYLDLVGTNLNSWLYNYGGGKFELQTTDDDNSSYMLFGKDANGKPLFLNNVGDDMSTANSRISNTPPHAPQGLRATQDEDGYLTISWNAAEDTETPACQMRYNLSVKKQGASGEGAFIISPLNGLSNEAAPLPSPLQELTGTQIRIPVSALPVGKYEIQIQSIDRWFATSDFTTPLAVEILPKPLLSLPPRICRDKSATIRYVGTEGRQIQVDFGADATVLDHSDDHTYEVVWSTAGQKTLTVTVDGISSEVSTYVNPPLDATFTLPGITLAHTKTNFEISDDIFMANRSVSFTVKSQDDDDFYTPGHYGISFERKENTKEVRATFTHTGHYTVRMTVEDDGCGNIYQERTIDVLEGMEAPQIALVTVDPTTGKNRINWKFRNLPDYISTVCIYKEGSHYNQFDLIGEAQPSDEGFTDMASNPAVTTSRYRICLNTSFGIPTESGTPHQSVHLTINKGMNGSWNLMWNAYSGRDIDHYRILRGTSPETLTEIATVSGSTQSYTDLTAPEGVVYYAIAYSAYYEDEWQPMKRSLAMASAQSNTASAAQAQNLRLAEELAVTHLEKDAILNEQQACLHLYAHIYPANASCKNVNWTIIQGEELAYVTPQGLLVAHGTQAGQIIVRATTIDGSQLHQDLTVEKASFPVPVESIRIYPEDELYIDNATGVQRIELAAKVYPEEATNPQVVWNIIEGSEFAYIEEDASGHTYLHATQNGKGTIEVKSVAYPGIRDTRAFHAVGFPGSDIRSSRENTIHIYPAIVTENLHACHMPAHSEKQIYVIGLDGRCKHAEQTWETDIRIPCHSFPSGVYLLKVVTNGQTVTRKFIKK